MHKSIRKLATLASLALAVAMTSEAAAKPSDKDLKVNTYVQIINDWSNYVYDNRSRHAKWVSDMNTGPTCKERGISGPSGVGDDAAQTYQAFRKAMKKGPKLDADEAALQMVTALEELIKPVKEATDYFDRAKYKSDDCKRGKELHTILVATWNKYIEGDRKVRAFVDKYNDERQAAELADDLKKYGKKLRYYHHKLPIDAKALIRAVDAVPANKSDTTDVRAAMAALAQSLSEVKPIVAQEKKGKNSDALYQGGYEQFVMYAGRFKDDVDEWVKAVDEEVKDPKANKGHRERARTSLIGSYNSFVDQTNQTMFSKGMK